MNKSCKPRLKAHKGLIVLAGSLALLTGTATRADEAGAVVGTAVGGAAGAAIGASSGGGNGAVVGGAIGAVLGAIIGSNASGQVVVTPAPVVAAPVVVAQPTIVYAAPPPVVYAPPPVVYYPSAPVVYGYPQSYCPPPVAYGAPVYYGPLSHYGPPPVAYGAPSYHGQPSWGAPYSGGGSQIPRTPPSMTRSYQGNGYGGGAHGAMTGYVQRTSWNGGAARSTMVAHAGFGGNGFRR